MKHCNSAAEAKRSRFGSHRGQQPWSHHWTRTGKRMHDGEVRMRRGDFFDLCVELRNRLAVFSRARYFVVLFRT